MVHEGLMKSSYRFKVKDDLPPKLFKEKSNLLLIEVQVDLFIIRFI